MKQKYVAMASVGALAITIGVGYSAQANNLPELPVYGISATISKAPTLEIGDGQFFQVVNKLRLGSDTEAAGMKLMNDNGEEFLLEQRNGSTYVGGEIQYSEVYTAFWPESGKYMPVPVILEGPMNIGHINFANGSATLDSADKQLLSAMADEIEHTGLKAVYMVGRADSTGSYDANMAISLKRAQAAKSYLLNHLAEMGITDVVISVDYMGSATASSKQNSEDRRVDVTIYPRL